MPLDGLVEFGTTLGNECPLPLVWDGTTYATVVADTRYALDEVTSSEAVFVQFDEEGRVHGPGWRYREPDRGFSGIDLAAETDGYGMVWCGNHGALTFIALDATGKPVMEPVDLVRDVGLCRPQIGWDGESFLVAWTVIEDRLLPRSGPQLGFVRTTNRGALLAGPLALYEDAAGEVDRPSLAVSDRRLLVTFVHRSPACAAEAGGDCVQYVVGEPSGHVLAASFPLSPIGRGGPDAATTSAGFGILWQGPTTARVDPQAPYLATVDDNGNLTAAPRSDICGLSTRCSSGSLALAWGRMGFGIVGSDREAWFARTDRAGMVVDAVSALEETEAWNVNLAFDGEGFGAIGLRLALGLPVPLFWRYRLVDAAE